MIFQTGNTKKFKMQFTTFNSAGYMLNFYKEES